jgi:hypothetical protein
VSDRELLELAAKAAGIDGARQWYSDARRHCAFWSYDEPMNCGARWNPLTDDGDALRLAVKLGLTLQLMSSRRGFGQRDETVLDWSLTKPTPDAATRRAIFRAAAEIGRNMK